MKYFVFYINFDYFADQAFDNVSDALAYAKKVCFEAAIYQGRGGVSPLMVATWSPIGGTRMYV
jgi:hypothetical protein